MKEIIVDHNIWTLLKKEVGKNLDGAGRQKQIEYLFESYEDKNDKELLKEKLLLAEGKRKIKCNLDIEEYKNFLEECYNKLKFLRQLNQENIKSHFNIAVFLYDLDPMLVDRSNKEIEERKKLLKKIDLEYHEDDVTDLSHKNNNYTAFNIFLENDEIIFKRAETLEYTPLINMGNIEIHGFSSNSISHIVIKKLPYQFKKNLDIHPSLYKRTQKKEFIESQLYYLNQWYSGLHCLYISADFSQVSDIAWDTKQKEFLNYIKEGKKLLPKIKEIHNNKPFEKSQFVSELNFRMTMDSINSTHVLMEVYIKSADSLREKDIANYSKKELKELDEFKHKYRKIEGVLPLFPITILIQKRRVEIMQKSHPHLFNANKESLSYFK